MNARLSMVVNQSAERLDLAERMRFRVMSVSRYLNKMLAVDDVPSKQEADARIRDDIEKQTGNFDQYRKLKVLGCDR
jgi:hypothetical protein